MQESNKESCMVISEKNTKVWPSKPQHLLKGLNNPDLT